MITKKLMMLFLMFAFFASNNSSGQSLVVSMDNNEELRLHIYEPAFIAKPILKDTLEAPNNYPEQLMISIMSANSRDWFNYNNLEFEELSDKDLAKLKSRDETNDFFELKAKLNFKVNGAEMAFVKFYLHTKSLEKPISGCYLLEKINNRWFKSSKSWATGFSIMFMRLNESKLEELIERKTSAPLISALAERVYENQTLNLDKLLYEVINWYKTNDTENKTYFIDKNAW